MGWKKGAFLVSSESYGHDNVEKCYQKSFRPTVDVECQLEEAAPWLVRDSGVCSAGEGTSNQGGSSERARKGLVAKLYPKRRGFTVSGAMRSFPVGVRETGSGRFRQKSGFLAFF